MFGYQFDPSVKQVRYWGARAIYESNSIGLLSDRQTMTPDNSPEESQFIDWLNGHALPWLRKELALLQLSTSDPHVIVLHQFKYELRATTNGSYGYMYIGAIEHELIDCESHINPATKKSERVVQAGGVKFVVDDGVVPVGTTGKILVNGIGPAKVVGYYNENYADEIKLACLMVEVTNPPEWVYAQHCRNDAERMVKRGLLPKDQPLAKSKEFKAWKKAWTLQHFCLWPNDFKALFDVRETPA